VHPGWIGGTLAFVAVVMATINVVGGYMVTHRMLSMFRKKG
jgi:NAD(P) transhydrogenase subunit alpha